MEIVFCEKCQTRIGAKDIESGAAVRQGEAVYCPACARELNLPSAQAAPAAAQRARTTREIRPRAGAQAEGARRPRHDAAEQSAPVPPPGGSGKVIAAAVGASVFAFAAVAVLLRVMGSPEPGRVQDAGAASDPAPQAARSLPTVPTTSREKPKTPAAAEAPPAAPEAEQPRSLMGSLRQGGSATSELPAKDAAGTGGEAKAPPPPAQEPPPPPPAQPPAAKEAYGPVPAPAGYSIPEKVLYRASFEDGPGKWSNVEVVPGGLGESTRCARLVAGKRAEHWGVKTKMSPRTVFRFACFISQDGGAESFQLLCWDETAKDNYRVQYSNLERGKWLVFTARLSDWFAWNREDKPDGHDFNSISVSPTGGTVVFDDLVIYEE